MKLAENKKGAGSIIQHPNFHTFKLRGTHECPKNTNG